MAKKDVKENVDETVEEVKGEVEAPKVPKQDIIRGRMPLPIVAMIKFGDETLTDGALAAKYRTTNGKVSDIRKDRNFGYIRKDYVPSAEMIEKAVVYAGQLDDKTVLEKVNSLKPATEDESKKFDEARKASRPSKSTPPAASSEEVQAEEEVSDEDLSSLTE